MTTMSPNFRKMVSSVTSGDRLIPALRAYLHNPRFPSFEVPIGAFEDREPDGWFHPSTHPLWPERMLYYYLTDAASFVADPIDPESTMAITVGNFWHFFMQCCLVDMGQLDEVEYSVEDPETGSRGSMDGLLVESPHFPREGWEFKTMHPAKLHKITDLDAFMVLCPGYYAQAQEYLRLSGLTQQRVLLMEPLLPFTMKEIVVPYDLNFAMGIRDKYRRVRQAVADQWLPDPCCSPKTTESKACPARTICPVGLIR